MLHPSTKLLEIGYALVPTERGKGYCTEGAMILVDYLFLSTDTICVQGSVDVRNVASQKVLEKARLRKEDAFCKIAFIRGEWRDGYPFSILREEWKEPKILTKTASQS